MTAEQDLTTLPKLLRQIGNVGEYRATRLPGGTNNRVYRVDTASGRYAFKVYYSIPSEPRDRLVRETNFVRYAWTCGLRCVPEFLAADADHHCALYRFVDGATPTLADIDGKLVEQAATFCRELDRHRDTPLALELPLAADACLSLAQHLESLTRRLDRLKTIQNKDLIHARAHELVAEAFEPLCGRICIHVRDCARVAGNEMNSLLARQDQCISASDFGFHNALMDSRKNVTFLDFEYGGWDDPAKMIADFFGQAERPVPVVYFDRFLETFAAGRSDATQIARRARLLLPLHRVKWAMILMNSFLQEQTDRRAFAGASEETMLRRQIDKASAILSSVTL